MIDTEIEKILGIIPWKVSGQEKGDIDGGTAEVMDQPDARGTADSYNLVLFLDHVVEQHDFLTADGAF